VFKLNSINKDKFYLVKYRKEIDLVCTTRKGLKLYVLCYKLKLILSYSIDYSDYPVGDTK